MSADADAPRSPSLPPGEALRESVRRYYTDRLENEQGCCASASGLVSLDASPDATPSFGCGEPTLFAGLRPGERVLDLGSGAGLDAFRAADAVGAEGRVIGVDMTPAMLVRARRGARRLGLANVDFLEGLIEALPLPEASVDVVLSNCVVNLAADKGAVFREAFRVLRPGGRLAISDVLRNGERTAPTTTGGWCACVDGAESPQRYRGYLRDAGFSDIAVDEPGAGIAPGGTYSAVVRAVRPDIRAVTDRDGPAVRRLLDEARLPLAGLDDGTVEIFVASAPAAGGPPLGVVAFERHGEAVLLRSLAVSPRARGRGLGVALVRHAEREARAAGARTAYALTTTIPGLLERLGYRAVARADLPPEILASAEPSGVCPASAAVFTRPLGG